MMKSTLTSKLIGEAYDAVASLSADASFWSQIVNSRNFEGDEMQEARDAEIITKQPDPAARPEASQKLNMSWDFPLDKDKCVSQCCFMWFPELHQPSLVKLANKPKEDGLPRFVLSNEDDKVMAQGGFNSGYCERTSYFLTMADGSNYEVTMPGTCECSDLFFYVKKEGVVYLTGKKNVVVGKNYQDKYVYASVVDTKNDLIMYVPGREKEIACCQCPKVDDNQRQCCFTDWCCHYGYTDCHYYFRDKVLRHTQVVKGPGDGEHQGPMAKTNFYHRYMSATMCGVCSCVAPPYIQHFTEADKLKLGDMTQEELMALLGLTLTTMSLPRSQNIFIDPGDNTCPMWTMLAWMIVVIIISAI
eukprot:m.15572 g.15572  ORF g.15572 m.15572 type:complete len:359 (-) comp5434_c0_seq1:41-1117(-)